MLDNIDEAKYHSAVARAEAKHHIDTAKDRGWITEAEHLSILQRLTRERHHDVPVDHETTMPSVYTYRVVPCKIDARGKIIINRDGPPYGYHHIHKVSPDGSSHLIAMIHASIAEAELFAIARILATPALIEIEREEQHP